MLVERRGPSWSEGRTQGEKEVHTNMLCGDRISAPIWKPVLLTHIPTLEVHSFLWKHSPAPSWLADVQFRDAHPWSVGCVDSLCNLCCSTMKVPTFSSCWVLSLFNSLWLPWWIQLARNLKYRKLRTTLYVVFLYCTEWGKLLVPV